MKLRDFQSKEKNLFRSIDWKNYQSTTGVFHSENFILFYFNIKKISLQ